MKYTPTLDVYARVSLASDLKRASVDGQVAYCSGRLADLGYARGEVHVDHSISAWNPRKHRPAWDRLMGRLERRETDGVIMFDLARFSRRPIDGERIITAAELGLVVLDSESAYDLTSANGKKTFRDHVSAAAYESDRLSTRVRRGKAQKIADGGSNHSRRPFGFEPDGFTLMEPEASVVREACQWFLNGGSIIGLHHQMKDSGVVTTFGNPFQQASIRALLLRGRNAGLLESKGEVVGRFPEGTPTIITMDEHLAIKARFAARRRGRPYSECYLGSGVLVCWNCGNNLHGSPFGGTYSDGEKRRRYACDGTYPKPGCNKVTIDWRPTDAAIESMVLARLGAEELATANDAAVTQAAEQRGRLQAQIGDAEATAAALAGRLGRGEMSLAEHDEFMATHRPRLTRLRADLAAIPAAPVSTEDDGRTRAELLAAWKEGSMDVKRRLIRRAFAGTVIVVMPANQTGPRVFNPARLRVGTREQVGVKPVVL